MSTALAVGALPRRDAAVERGDGDRS